MVVPPCDFEIGLLKVSENAAAAVFQDKNGKCGSNEV
jgi:hypothetical protein